MKERFHGTVKYLSMSDLRKKPLNNEISSDSVVTDQKIYHYLQSIENRNQTVVIIDELKVHVPRCDTYNPLDKSSYLQKVFEYLKQEFKMALIILSSTSIVDRADINKIIPDEFGSFIERMANAGFNYFELKKIVRNSQSIVSATSVTNINSCLKISAVHETISSGHGSTVVGVRPSCIMYTLKNRINGNQDAKCEALARCIGMYFEKIRINISNTNLKVVIICGAWTNNLLLLGKKLSEAYSNANLYVFDSDHKKFDKSVQDCRRIAVQNWLQTGGLLITSPYDFNECEADVTIMVGPDRLDRFPIGGHRNVLVRGVAHLCLIMGKSLINSEEISKFYDVLSFDGT